MATGGWWADSSGPGRAGCVPVHITLPSSVLLPQAESAVHLDGGGGVRVGGCGTSREQEGPR